MHTSTALARAARGELAHSDHRRLAIQRPIAFSMKHVRSVEDLLQLADEAMYKAKHARKGRVEETIVDT